MGSSDDTGPLANYAAAVGTADREAELERFLDALVAGELPAYVGSTVGYPPDRWAGQLRRLAQTLTGDWSAALADPGPAADPHLAGLAAAVTAWAAAWDPGAEGAYDAATRCRRESSASSPGTSPPRPCSPGPRSRTRRRCGPTSRSRTSW